MKKNSDLNDKFIHSDFSLTGNKCSAISMPIVDGSTIAFDDYKTFLKFDKYYKNPRTVDIKMATSQIPPYGRSGCDTVIRAEKIIAELNDGDFCKLLPSGMAAIRLAIFSFCTKDSHILVQDGIYGPTKQLIGDLMLRFGVEYTFFDPMANESDLKKLIKKNTKLIYVESPCSQFFEVGDIGMIANFAKKNGIVSIIDNSYATSIFCNPIKLGFDVVVMSLTKFPAGHSDLLAGAIISKKEHFPKIYADFMNFGDNVSALKAYNIIKGIRTMPVRMERSQKSGKEVVDFLSSHKKISNVYYPALKTHIGYSNFKKYFSGAPGLFSVALNKKYNEEKLASFFDGMTKFSMGYSYGGYESLAIQIEPKNSRLHSKFNPDADKTHIRFYIGMEDVFSIIDDLEECLKKL